MKILLFLSALTCCVTGFAPRLTSGFTGKSWILFYSSRDKDRGRPWTRSREKLGHFVENASDETLNDVHQGQFGELAE